MASAKTTHFNLLRGLTVSNCNLPCTITKTYTKKVSEVFNYRKMMTISFTKEMQVTKTSIVPFSIVDFFSGMGGILGLWMGLGALQIIELVMRGVRRISGDIKA